MFLHIKTCNGVLQNTYLNCLSPVFNMNHANLITYNPYFCQMSTNVCSYAYITLTQMKSILAVILTNAT